MFFTLNRNTDDSPEEIKSSSNKGIRMGL